MGRSALPVCICPRRQQHMQHMTTEAMLGSLMGVPEGSTLFISYIAGRPATPRAITEATRHTTNPTRPRRYYLGQLSSVWQTLKGDWVVTLKVFNRDTGPSEGGYRSFNPNVGRLLLIDVIHAANDVS